MPPLSQPVPPAQPSGNGQAQAPAPLDPQAELQKSLNPIQLSPKDLSDWWARIEASEARIKCREDKWDALLKEYTPNVSESNAAELPKVNTHFRNIHTKTGQLFVRSPKIIMSPKGPALDQIVQAGPMGQPIVQSPSEALPTRQAVINYFMGPEEIDGVWLMDECLFDMQGHSGLAAVKVGYRSVSRTVQKPVMQPDPTYVPPPPTGIMGLAPSPPPPQVPVVDPLTGQPQTEPIPVIIHEEWYAEKFSSKKLLLDELLHSPRVEKRSRWIGWKNFEPKRKVMRMYGLAEDQLGNGVEEDDRIYLDDDERATTNLKDLVCIIELFYKASFFTDDDRPDAINQLVLIQGLKEQTIVSRPSPDQTFDEEGKLTYDSLIGFPIKVGSLRDFQDSPFAMADSAFTNAQAKNLDVHIQNSLKLRDAAIGKYFYDTDVIDGEDLKKLQSGEVGAFIGLKGGALMQGADKVFYTTAQVKATSDDFRTAAWLKSNINETLGISETSAGGNPDTVRSATEIKDSSAGSAGRQEKEQSRVVNFYLSIVRAIDTLIFRYATGDRYVEVVGEDGAKRLAMWNKKLGAGCYSYDIKPDSQLRNDAARDRQQKIAAYTTMAPDPMVNRPPILRDIARDFGWDPSLIVLGDPMAQAMQPPHAGGNGNGAQQGPKHMAEKSGGTPNGPGKADTGDNRQERNPRPGGPA